MTGERHRHRWTAMASAVDGEIVRVWSECRTCGREQDLERAATGRSARRLGGDTERRIERTYGPRKVGEHGDAVDLVGRVWKWQSKATRETMPRWLAKVTYAMHHEPPAEVRDAERAMLALRPELRPLVIVTHVRQGVKATDHVWVRCEDWRMEHGWRCATSDGCEWLVMSGAHFLDMNGRDVPVEREGWE